MSRVDLSRVANRSASEADGICIDSEEKIVARAPKTFRITDFF